LLVPWAEATAGMAVMAAAINSRFFRLMAKRLGTALALRNPRGVAYRPISREA